MNSPARSSTGGTFLGGIGGEGAAGQELPEGVAFRLKAGHGVMLNVHYINTGTEPIDGDAVVVPGGQELVMARDMGGYQIKVEDGPWPAFPADLTSIALALATQAQGTVLIFEKMFENRLVFTDKLVFMGANIILCDPHRAVVTGPARLRGQRVESPDIRAGMAMLIAALCAEGRSEIGNVRQIDRGYERIDERLRGLGAQIERVPA